MKRLIESIQIGVQEKKRGGETEGRNLHSRVFG